MWPIFVRSRTRAPSDVPRFQCCLRPYRVSRGADILFYAESSLLDVELQNSLIRNYPEFPEPLHTLDLLDTLTSHKRTYHPGRPLILPIDMSLSPAFNFVAMSSYDHFYFLQHVLSSAFPYVNASTILPLAEG